MTQQSEGFYINSNMGPGSLQPPSQPTRPAAPPEPLESQPEGRDGIRYPSLIDAGMEVIDFPRRGLTNTGRPADTIPVKILGRYVAEKCEAAIERGEGAQELGWHVGNAKGAGLIDAATAKRFDQFVTGMAKATDQRAYFHSEVKPLLYSLRPAPRPKGDQ